MTPSDFLKALRAEPGYEGQIVHVEDLPPRDARHAAPLTPLPPWLAAALEQVGIRHLYTHQASTLDAVRAGLSPVIVSGTASGKTLAYHLPVLETLLADPGATALYLFPTKALARDQVRQLEPLVGALAASRPEAASLRPHIFDGDLSSDERRRVRDEARIVFSNPDMIHRNLLPQHARWTRLLGNLRYVVVDEVHTLRGIFGTHTSLVLRRLNRLCRHYGIQPRYLCGSATIANPVEHATRLTDTPMHLIDDDGSPRGPVTFVFWNAPPLKPRDVAASGLVGDFAPRLRSGNVEGEELLRRLLRAGFRTLAFTKSWLASELLYRYTRESLEAEAPELARAVAPYRGGYLPDHRRAVERALFDGSLRGIVSTNALELGIDLGDLDAVLILGYPGTIASTWQQAGRAGRGQRPALVFLVAYDTPINQYLVRHPGYFFSKAPEHARIHPQNPYALADHLLCACHEHALSPEETREEFGETAAHLLDILESERQLRRVKGRYYSVSPRTPAWNVSLRNIMGRSFAVQERETGEVLATVDEISAYPNFHPEAVYLHDDRIYLVEELDTEKRIAWVKRADVDYYTDPIGGRGVRFIDAVEDALPLAAGRVCFGEVTAHFHTVAYRKIRFWSRDCFDLRKVDLPPLELKTVAFWLEPDDSVTEAIRRHERHADDATMGLGHAFMMMTSLYAMCHPLDIRNSPGWECVSGVHRNTVFLFDNYPGGMGFAEMAWAHIEEFLDRVRGLIRECDCAEGCPACVGYHLRPFVRFDPQDSEGLLPDKHAALLTLHRMLGLPPYDPPKPSTRRRTWRRRVVARPDEDSPFPSASEAAGERRLHERTRESLRRLMREKGGPDPHTKI